MFQIKQLQNNSVTPSNTYNRVRKVNLTNGVISNFAGTGFFGFSGDGGPATNAQFVIPDGVCTDGIGRLSISDLFNDRVRQVNPVTGIITTIAGSAFGNISAGDGGPATSALLLPTRLTADRAGNVFVHDTWTNSVRRIAAATGIITTVAGGGANAPGSGPATNMNLGEITDLVVSDAGKLYIADYTRVFVVDLATGQLSPFAGGTNGGFSGDGGPALDARFNNISSLALAPGGGLLIASSGQGRIRYVVPDSINLTNDTQQTAFYLPWVSALAGELTIADNPNLTTVDMSSLVTVGGSVDLSGNTSVTTVDMSSLVTSGGFVDLSENPSLTTIDASSLVTVGGSVDLGGNTSLTTVDMSSLVTSGGFVDLSENPSLTTVDMSSLVTCGGSVDLSGNTSLTTVDMSSLVTSGGFVDLSGNTSLTTIDASSLVTCGGSLDISGNTNATLIDLSSLTTVSGSLDISGDTSATLIDMSSLVTCGGSLDISGNTNATLIDLSSLTTVSGSLDISGDTSATLIDLSSLTTCGGSLDLNGNTSATNINMSALVIVTGELKISGNSAAAEIDLSSLTSGSGNLTIASNAPDAVIELNSLTTFGCGTNEVTLTLNGGTVQMTNGLTLCTNATLTGSTTLDGSITNHGTIEPGASPGQLNLSGHLVLADSSRVRLEIGGYAPGQFDVVNVSGSVALGGTLAVTLVNGFASVMTNGADFTALSGGAPVLGALANVPNGGSLTTTEGYARFTVLYAGASTVRLTDLVMVDTDADSIPNWWEDQFGLNKTNSADATLDLDGDGASNLNEFLAGTRPNDATSVFRITALQPEGSDLRVTWTTVGGKSYVVQTNGDMGKSFADSSPLIPAPGAGESVTNFVDSSGTTNGPRYYRVRLQP